jgi:hypothetical protein
MGIFFRIARDITLVILVYQASVKKIMVKTFIEGKKTSIE